MFVYVNIGEGKGRERLVLYEGEEPILVAREFVKRHGLGKNKGEKLEKMLEEKVRMHKKRINLT